MLTTLFVITRIISNPLSNVFQKKLAGQQSTGPIFIIFITHALLSLAAFPALLAMHPLQLSSQFWFNILLCAVLAFAGNSLIVMALRDTDLSILGPINAYKSVISVGLGIVLLGEYPGLSGIAGILMILLGSYYILDKGTRQAGAITISINRGILLRLLALVFSATEAIFLKKALLFSSPMITFLAWCVLGVPIGGLGVLLLDRGSLSSGLTILRHTPRLFLQLALTTGLMQLSTLYTFGALQVGYSLALFQVSTLLTVLFGYQFFQEKNIARRLFGAGIMVLGAILIISFNT
jgi:drug/metabolite transporter (DMT)-like permease